jgi:hypothetical protein
LFQPVQGSKLMLTEREKPGYFCFRNSYWQISLFSIKGRAVPWLPLLIYLIYTTAVCVGVTKIPGYKQVRGLGARGGEESVGLEAMRRGGGGGRQAVAAAAALGRGGRRATVAFPKPAPHAPALPRAA